jgi:hypothetical protein
MAYLEYTPQDALFHYTNIQGFEGILSSRRLWLNDLRMTNDPREIKLGQDLLIKALTHIRHEKYTGSRGFPISVFAGRINEYLARGGIFSCSMSHQGDSLPMWREYGDACRGLNIGFRPRALTDMHLRISKVRYVDESSFEELVRFLEPNLETLLSANDGLEESINSSVIAGDLCARIANLKHNSWSYEKEIRLSHAADPKNQQTEIHGVRVPSSINPDGTEYYSEVLSRKGADGKTVNYVELEFGRFRYGDLDATSAIEKVVLGPKCSVSREDVETLLKRNGFENYRVDTSECLIR